MPVALESMTGFARDDGGYEELDWRWEIRSVNNKGLDVRLRMPPGHESLELKARDMVSRRFRRGSFQVTLNVGESKGPTGYRLNSELLDRVLELAEAVRARTGSPPPRVEGLFRLRGILEPEEPAEEEGTRAAREAALLESLAAALDKLSAARSAEGARLADLLAGFLDEIRDMAGRARDLAAAQPHAIADRLRAQVDELLAGSPAPTEDRLAQEIALLVTKADIREEIDRLDAHVAQAQDLLAAGGAVGRRLDFLTQEFNREANTLCSKAQDLELTRIGLDMKAVIEQFREQVQNIQ